MFVLFILQCSCCKILLDEWRMYVSHENSYTLRAQPNMARGYGVHGCDWVPVLLMECDLERTKNFARGDGDSSAQNIIVGWLGGSFDWQMAITWLLAIHLLRSPSTWEATTAIPDAIVFTLLRPLHVNSHVIIIYLLRRRRIASS